MINANYEYIISSLPDIDLDWKYGDGASFESYIGWIKSQLEPSDIKKLDTLLEGFKDENLNLDFYKAVTKDGNRFIREYFTFDMNVRNGKARFLNRAFGRLEDQDTMPLEVEAFPEEGKLQEALSAEDLLLREKSLDQLMWNKISEIILFEYFNIEVILAFVAKLHIIDRWLALDEKTGREMFRSLVEEVRKTFKGVNYVEPTE